MMSITANRRRVGLKKTITEARKATIKRHRAHNPKKVCIVIIRYGGVKESSIRGRTSII